MFFLMDFPPNFCGKRRLRMAKCCYNGPGGRVIAFRDWDRSGFSGRAPWGPEKRSYFMGKCDWVSQSEMKISAPNMVQFVNFVWGMGLASKNLKTPAFPPWVSCCISSNNLGLLVSN